MLRRSRVTRFIVPSSSGEELPRFLAEREKLILTTSGDLYAFVMEYDRRSTMPRLCSGPPHSDLLSRHLFSGSPLAGVLTAGGVAFFVLTFGYNVGKPVVDAHRKFFWKRADAAYGKRSRETTEGAAAEEEEERDGLSPMEEFDDLIEAKGKEG
ncbi:hypothetical predicted transmembrane protein [Leishmania mexicana MHOM/GT/2001/U1103]|uniref:Hypothetical predicted transmembrane protein n=1 Tax=Leishmania mexicana (strain MHOM/GT/2001/U1103) TaxID=929439 RepID=E9AWQ9_LEIMU|nr:hypothetical predicted transmembrane protein [Leishmania mexicana MHOM/GT/2001/U1103]CBZ27395.1 hypothetical predicted transmembrane protein [Leishmania mexicana MHOM/GT/2001/U1103]